MSGVPKNGQRQEEIILDALVSASGSIVTREALLDALYPDGEWCESNVVTVLIMRLRKQLKGRVQIKTRHGLGYQLIRTAP